MFIVLTKLRNGKKVLVNVNSVTYVEPFFGDDKNTTIYFGATNAENPFQVIVKESLETVYEFMQYPEKAPSL